MLTFPLYLPLQCRSSFFLQCAFHCLSSQHCLSIMDTNSASVSRVKPKNGGHTTKDKNKYCFEWTIHKFSNHDYDRVLGSRIFYTDSTNECIWQMQIIKKSFPGPFRKSFLTVNLQLLSGNINGKLNSFKICLLNSERRNLVTSTMLLSSTETRWDVRLVAIDRLDIYNLLPGDGLTVHCEVSGPGHSLEVRSIHECSS